MLKKFAACLSGAALCLSTAGVYAANITPTLMYVPQDNRPISFNQTADAVANTGLKVITPPENLLGNRENPKGHPQELSQWAQDQAQNADVAVISSDAMLYGSLVASRQEDHNKEQVINNANSLINLKLANPNLKIYVFGSIMRTPQSIQASGGTDAALYAKYGNDIAKYTALLDKQEQGKLSRKDKKALKAYKNEIPEKALQAWLDLRAANLAASYKLIDYTRDGFIDYLALGADDNAPYSMTNMERRALDAYALKSGLNKMNYHSVAGIDELGYVLLTRGVNHIKGDIPFVSVHYAKGMGAKTIPAYSNEPISRSIAAHIVMAKGLEITKDKNADVIFMVNTTEKGTTGAANNPDNTATVTPHLADFIASIQEQLKHNRNVSVADIAFANGADNGLMTGLYENNLLDKLGGYAGWNTPTNSSGFALAMGMNANYTAKDKNMDNLALRYLDDWLYQANARQTVAQQLNSFPGQGGYMNLDTRLKPAEQATTELIRSLSAKYQLEQLPGQSYLPTVEVTFPWNRMFEANFTFNEDK